MDEGIRARINAKRWARPCKDRQCTEDIFHVVCFVYREISEKKGGNGQLPTTSDKQVETSRREIA